MLARLQTTSVTLSDEIISLASTDPAMIPTTLVNQLAEYAQSLMLVLDDFYLITDPRIQIGMAFLLEHLSAGVALVLNTRADPLFQLVRLWARRQLVELRVADLRFMPKARHINRHLFVSLVRGRLTRHSA